MSPHRLPIFQQGPLRLVTLVLAISMAIGFVIPQHQGLVVLAIVSALLFVLTVVHPRVGLLAVFLYSTVHAALSAGSTSLPVSASLNIGLVALGIAIWLRRASPIAPFPRRLWPLLAFATIAILELANRGGYSLLNTLSDAAELVLPALAFWIGLSSPMLRPNLVYLTISVVAALHGLIGLAQVAGLLPLFAPSALAGPPVLIDQYLATRPVSTMGPYILSSFCAIGVITAITLYLSAHRAILRFTALTASVISAALILAAGVRTMWIGTALALMPLLRSRGGLRSAAALLALLLMTVVAIAIDPAFFGARSVDILQPFNSQSTVLATSGPTPGRLYFWSALIPALLSHPIGFGLGTFGISKFYGGEASINPTALFADNDYLYVALETGWLGIAAYIAFLAVVWEGIWRKPSDAADAGPWTRSGRALLILFVVVSAFGSYLRLAPGSWTVWFLLGYLYARQSADASIQVAQANERERWEHSPLVGSRNR